MGGAGSGGAGGLTMIAGSGGAGGVSGSAGSPVDAPAATVADYAKLGPYGKAMRLTNQGKGTITGGTTPSLGEGGDDASAFTVFLPQGVQNAERFPLLTWGNGTLCSPTLYDELMNFIVSYGYVVVATNTSNAGSGSEMLKAVDWALAQNDKADSPLHGLIDPDKIGAFGHSQGGEGAVNTGSDPRIRALAPLSAGPMGSGEGKIQCPTFYTLTANDVVTPDSYRASYDGTKAPSVYGVTTGGDHMEYCDKAQDIGLPGLTSNDALMTRSAISAWFDWQLKGKQQNAPLFIGTGCGYCKDSNWKSFESKGF
jgi:dienelactone hydrolase